MKSWTFGHDNSLTRSGMTYISTVSWYSLFHALVFKPHEAENTSNSLLRSRKKSVLGGGEGGEERGGEERGWRGGEGG